MPDTRTVHSVVGPLGDPDDNGLRLPDGFTSRIVARSGIPPVPDIDYVWHDAPDGGATFPADDGGWIYVSNSEMSDGRGGVGALRFGSDGALLSAYSILNGTNRNCAGGPTPWGTWLSCEETPTGSVWECDPTGSNEAVVRPALGIFQHEAAAVDVANRHIYLTEDEFRGCFYRFTADGATDGRLDLTSGILEVAQVIGGPEGPVIWRKVRDPLAREEPTRRQVSRSTKFKGGEGAWFHNGTVYFTTKHDNRVWAYDTEEAILEIVYDEDSFRNVILSVVDNITVSKTGILYVAEEKGDMQIVMIDRFREVAPIVQIVGHPRSEVTGPAFDPSGTRLYFSSQTGPRDDPSDGVTFEMQGPFDRFDTLGPDA